MIKRYLPKTFFLRSILILVAPVICIHIISGYIFFHRHLGNISSLLSENIAGEISSILYFSQHHDFKIAQKIAKNFYDINLILTLDFPNNSSKYLIFDDSLSKHISYPYRLKKTHDLLTLWIKTPLHVYQFQLPTKRLVPRTHLLFILWALGSSIVFLIIAAIVMRNQMKPLYRLIKWTKELQKENPKPLLKIEGAREIRKIATAIQGAVNRIRRNFQERNRMLLGISHDLRTPLTRIKLNLQLMPQTQDIKDIQQDLNQMISMVNTYLLFVKQTKEKYQIISLAEVFQKIASTAISSVSVTLSIQDGIFLTVKPIQFGRCVQNLFDNALQYANETILISVYQQKDNVIIVIEDDGPGVPEHLRQDIFNPFFRGDEGRHLAGESVGLGLSIVKSIILDHGGDIRCERSSLGGAAFYLEFPVLL